MAKTRIKVIAFTQKGVELAKRVQAVLEDASVELFAHERFSSDNVLSIDSAKSFTQRYFDLSDALIFIGAAGIAVRSIAPYLVSKTSDPAVLVMDEAGSFIIPILSGHLGGSTKLADKLSDAIGACAVQTTASEVRGIQAVDSWAKEHQMHIDNPEEIVSVSSARLDGKEVGVAVTERLMPAPFKKTLFLRPKNLVLGLGCKKGADPKMVRDFILESLEDEGLSLNSVFALASIDIKATEPALIEFCEEFGLEFKTYSKNELNTVKNYVSKSDFVKSTVGVDCVCEKSALLAAGPTSELLVSKLVKSSLATLAIAHLPAQSLESDFSKEELGHKNWLALVGIGPGSFLDMTRRAYETLNQADYIIAYKRYIDLIKDEFPQARYINSFMKKEIERCKEALELSKDAKVALISSGDVGIYGMSALVYELMDSYPEYKDARVIAVSGVTAASASANLLGAPLSNDFACISLSNLLTPWEDITKRLTFCAKADIPIVLYNPRSKGRPDLLDQALKIIADVRDGSDFYIGLVKNASREGELVKVSKYTDFKSNEVDMLSCLIIASSQTVMMQNYLVTPRGYRKKDEF